MRRDPHVTRRSRSTTSDARQAGTNGFVSFSLFSPPILYIVQEAQASQSWVVACLWISDNVVVSTLWQAMLLSRPFQSFVRWKWCRRINNSHSSLSFGKVQSSVVLLLLNYSPGVIGFCLFDHVSLVDCQTLVHPICNVLRYCSPTKQRHCRMTN
jgi:hypothetical protein